jgi:hypothetical protein
MEHDRPADDGVSLHPWYGPCDGLARGECAECENVAAGVFSAWRADWEKRRTNAGTAAAVEPCHGPFNALHCHSTRSRARNLWQCRPAPGWPRP